jgi:hypothetical protein
MGWLYDLFNKRVNSKRKYTDKSDKLTINILNSFKNK